jgi:hypothetical protein
VQSWKEGNNASFSRVFDTDGGEWIVSMIAILIAAAVGLPLLYLAISKFGTVEADANGDREVRTSKKLGSTKFRSGKK